MKLKINIKDCFAIFLRQKSNSYTVTNYKQAWNIIKLLPIDSKNLDFDNLIKEVNMIVFKKYQNNNTRNSYLRWIKSFLKFFSEYNNQYFNWQKLKTLPIDYNFRQAFTYQELETLIKCLEEFNNPGFMLIFKLIATNGVRLGEFVKINWKLCRENDYKIMIKSSKNGNLKLFKIHPSLIIDFETYGIKYSYNTIQNLFTSFGHFVRNFYPQFKKPIHAHVLRHHFITKAFNNLISMEKVIALSGHRAPSTARDIYIKNNATILENWWEQANDTSIINLDLQQLQNLFETERQKVNYLTNLLDSYKIDYQTSPLFKK